MNARLLQLTLAVVVIVNTAYARADTSTGRPRGQPENAWRYQFYSGRWWFWTPDSRWAYYDGRQWKTSPLTGSRADETGSGVKAASPLPVMRGIDPADGNRDRRFYSPFVSGWQGPGSPSPVFGGPSPFSPNPANVLAPETSFGGTRGRSGDAGSGVGGGAVGGTTVTGGPNTGLAK